MTLSWTILEAAGRTVAVRASPALCVARALDRLTCEESTWVRVWHSLTETERRAVLGAARGVNAQSFESRIAGAVQGQADGIGRRGVLPT